MTYITDYDSPVGRLTVASDGRAVTGIYMAGQRFLPDFSGMADGEGLGVHAAAAGWLDRYFAGLAPVPDELPLAPEGTPFRLLVWEMLCRIPYGQTATYGEIAQEAAEKLGRRAMSAQAVGGAVGHNPISIVIPCHRVIGADGGMVGYGGGMERKLWLLRHEGVIDKSSQ